ncbi:Lon family ATP-dependent protease [Peptococcaceae bacterium]|nr:Lon family ATP-dependent protease [Peptococcaceae bacterium]
MKNFLEKFISSSSKETARRFSEQEQLRRRVNALYGLVSNIYGSEKLVLRAGKLGILNLMRSDKLEERVLALQKLVFEKYSLDKLPDIEEIDDILDEIEDKIADIIAKRSIEEEIEKKINEKIQARHEEYVREIKMQVLKEIAGPENAQTLKKLDHLEKLEQKKLAAQALNVLRPKSIDEIVGQKNGIKALISKLASPLPQHIIIYGPPGVGKTTAARLALEVAKKVNGSVFSEDSKFVEVDGTTLRWDPREIANPLLGSVHDPIYQGARRDLADTGVPEPKLGLVTEAHGGVLFIDEIGELNPVLQNKLLKVLEDKRVYFESAYYDPNDPNTPKYIKKIFEEGAPADFILIGATTREPEEINPAIRSRCAEVFFEALTPSDIKKIVAMAAEKLNVDLTDEAKEIISSYTIEGRKAVGILCDAYGLAYYKSQVGDSKSTKICITQSDVKEVIQSNRLTSTANKKASDKKEVGKIFGLGVSGFLGSVLEIEAISFPASKSGKGTMRFNDTAGSMAKDSVFNAASVIRKVEGIDINDFDIHINVVGGGRIDGPSAGVAITIAILSAIKEIPISQNVAVTGEISIRGNIKAVGGIYEKIYGAKQAGIKKVIIPFENKDHIPRDVKGIDVLLVKNINEAIEQVFS